jgi:hypothetical protein
LQKINFSIGLHALQGLEESFRNFETLILPHLLVWKAPASVAAVSKIADMKVSFSANRVA